MSMETAVNSMNAIDSSDANQDKFLSFCLGDEEYGVEILRVREIIGVLDITPLPQTPNYVKGVINLRGKIIPVIELRTKFAMPSVEYTEETCIIVVEVTDPTTCDQFHMGVVVDTVSEVQDIGRGNIEPAPKFGGALKTGYILGMGKVTDGDMEKVLILLDIDKVMTLEEVGDLAATASTDATADSAEEPSDHDTTALAA